MVAPLTANDQFRKSKTGSIGSRSTALRRPGRFDQRFQGVRHWHRLKGAHPRAAIIPCGEAAGQRTERDEQEPHRLTGSFTGIAELDRIAKHVPVGGEMRAHIGLAQYMFPFERLPRRRFISDSA